MILGLRSAVAAIAFSPYAAEASSSSNTDWVGYLLQGGPFAIILALILTDKLAPTGERNRLREENKQYKEDIQTLNDRLLQVLPGLTDAAQVISRVGDMVEAMNHPEPPPRNRGRGQ